ncbi:MAG TPA: SulP family inorganic anion transporter, partial [Candidatus Ozemobacteraceae bacterium]|nr:SulP family inorganic anion transporter [Candidatus Ozemobacteraceae bacterium]
MSTTSSIVTSRSVPTLTGDLWGGLASMLVALPASIAFGVLIYSSLGANFVAHGAMAGILGAAAIGIVAPLVGRNGVLISAPCAPAAAVLAAVTAELLSAGTLNITAATIPLLLGLIVLGAGLLQILYGLLGCGRLIKFIPYPVVTGYLSAVGLLIILGQLAKLTGLPRGTPLGEGLITPSLWKWPSVLVGLTAMLVMVHGQRLTKRIPAPVLGLGAGILAYFVLALFDRTLLQTEGNSLIVGPIQLSGSFLDLMTGRLRSLGDLRFDLLRLVIVPATTLSILLSIDTLKTCVVMDALSGARHNSDRELIAQGTGNVAAFAAGGMAGAGTMGPTLVNLSSGGQSWRSAAIEGAAVVAILAFVPGLVTWVPIGALAGILLVVAWRMIDRSMFRLLATPAGRQDFAVIATVVVTALGVDLIA